jgi:hypothetical protein
MNRQVKVTGAEAMAVTMTRPLVGTSSGASLAAAMTVLRDLTPDARVVTVLQDRAERYFSTARFAGERSARCARAAVGGRSMRSADFCDFYRRPADGEIDLLRSGLDPPLPTGAGGYILASNGTEFIYPEGRSPVFYIGKAKVIWRRLDEHRRLTVQAANFPEVKWWRPRYTYAVAFGLYAAWFTVRGVQEPEEVESDLCEMFYLRFGSIPVANMNWPMTDP